MSPLRTTPKYVALFIKYATHDAVDIVRAVLRKSPLLGLRTRQIFDACIEDFPNAVSKENHPQVRNTEKGATFWSGTPAPPHPDHPIRSIKYLKKIVLPAMVQKQEVEEVLIRRGPLDEYGNRQDIVSTRGPNAQKFVHPNAARAGAAMEWRWRLRVDREQVKDG